MNLFLSDPERKAFHAFRKENPFAQDLYWALQNRVEKYASTPGLHGPQKDTEWWFCAADRLSDGAIVYALKKTEPIGNWLRDATLSLVRRSEDDWIGPAFRDHSKQPAVGNLETAHLTWGIATVVDLAADVFSDSELDEVKTVLAERGLAMCRRWIDSHRHLANWRTVLCSGCSVAAAVLDDREEMTRSIADYQLNLEIFQPDGSYGESLQYANYAGVSLMLAREALLRRLPDSESSLPLEPWVLLPRWQAASHLYSKALSGWGSGEMPRAANFNDSAATFRPSADLLLMIASRGARSHPTEAGLARWMFEQTYRNDFTPRSVESASFGFVNDYGFLAVSLLPQAAAPCSPGDAGLPELMTFSCGDAIARDQWDGKTILATHGGGDPLRGPGHLHGDLNSFILAHNKERLLVDPGHSCYRNLIHALESSTMTHNTCSFEVSAVKDSLGLQEDPQLGKVLEQSRTARVQFDPATRKPGPPADRGARRLMAEKQGPVSAIGSAAAALYGPTIQRFDRYWFLCGSHVVFIVDHIEAARPVKTTWHWLLNNRDDTLELKIIQPDRIVARRPRAGMKLFHLGDGKLKTPQSAFVHDAYSPAPASPSEGKSGSGILVSWQQKKASTTTTAVHAIAVDTYGEVAVWHLKQIDNGLHLSNASSGEDWQMQIADKQSVHISSSSHGFEHEFRWE